MEKICLIVDNIEIDIKAANKNQPTETEPILADVMKNITRVNTMLQDLIKNYEKLEKLSKTHSEESDSTDTEVEELFNSERNKINRAKTKSTTTGPTHKAYATAMFFEERDPSPDSKSDDHDTKSSSDSEEEKTEEPPKKKVKQQKKDERGNKNEAKNIIRTVEKQAGTKNNASQVDNKAVETIVPAINALKDLIKDISDEPDSTDSGETNDKNEPITSTTSHTSVIVPIAPGKLLNLKEKSLPKEDKRLEPRLEHYEMPEVVRKARKNNDDDTILIGAPIKKDQTEKKEVSDPKKTAEPKNKKIEPTLSQSESESSDEIKIIQNEELKTSVLRQAYGDACLRLVVRKCYLACKSVVKNVCNLRRQCPKEFRGLFKKYAIRGCKDAFYNGNHSIDFRMYNGKKEDDVSDDFNDLTRAGYLSMACFPYQKKKQVNETTNPKQNVTIDPEIKSMNILRDRYEAACQEQSMRKCYKACTNAAKQACGEENCSSRRLKEFGVACKERCKKNYGIRVRKKDSDSDSDSSGDSDDSDDSNSKSGNDKSW